VLEALNEAPPRIEEDLSAVTVGEAEMVTLLVADIDVVALPDPEGVSSPLTDIKGETVTSKLAEAESDARDSDGEADDKEETDKLGEEDERSELVLVTVGSYDTVIPILAVIVLEGDALRENTIEELINPVSDKDDDTDADGVTPFDIPALLVTDTEFELDLSANEPLDDSVDD
jgi:hypothetical protein